MNAIIYEISVATEKENQTIKIDLTDNQLSNLCPEQLTKVVAIEVLKSLKNKGILKSVLFSKDDDTNINILL